MSYKPLYDIHPWYLQLLHLKVLTNHCSSVSIHQLHDQQKLYCPLQMSICGKACLPWTSPYFFYLCECFSFPLNTNLTFHEWLEKKQLKLKLFLLKILSWKFLVLRLTLWKLWISSTKTHLFTTMRHVTQI